MRTDNASPLTPPPPASASATPAAATTRPVVERPLLRLTSAQWAVQVNRHLTDCRRHRSSLALVLVSVELIHLVDAQGTRGMVADPALCRTVLERAGQRLCSRVRGTDRVVRLGDQRFGVLLVGAGARQAREIGSRLSSALTGSYRTEERLLVAESRSAFAAFPDDATSADALMRSLALQLPSD